MEVEETIDRLKAATDESTGQVREDALFFAHFTVPILDWHLYTRIENRGYMYWHRETLRPLFIYRLLTVKPPHKHHGYAYAVQLDAGSNRVVTGNQPFHPDETSDEIRETALKNLAALNERYSALGEYESEEAFHAAYAAFAEEHAFALGEFDDEPRRILSARRVGGGGGGKSVDES